MDKVLAIAADMSVTVPVSHVSVGGTRRKPTTVARAIDRQRFGGGRGVLRDPARNARASAHVCTERNYECTSLAKIGVIDCDDYPLVAAVTMVFAHHQFDWN